MNGEASIHFRLDSRSGVAPYRQLVAQVLSAVENGRLHGGDQLPSVREVVAQVTINPNTVHRAFRELEHLGIAEGRSGLGTFVCAYVTAGSERSELRAGLQRWIREARDQGISDVILEAMWREAVSTRETAT
jgi:GntR family transcriptional regulator